MGLRAAVAAFALVLGVVAADVVQPPAWAAATAGGLGLVFLVWTWLIHRRQGDPEVGQHLPSLAPPAAALLLAGSLLVGFCNMGLRSAAAEKALLPRVDGRVVQIAGTIISDPVRTNRMARLFLRVSRVEEASVREKLALSIFGPLPNLAPGDQVALEVKIRRLEPEDSYDEYLRRNGVAARGSASAPGLRFMGKTQAPLLSAANALRREISQAAKESLPGPRAGLLLGLMIGDETGISPATRQAFRAAGLSHLTAVSGANVAMVLAPLMLLLAAARVGRRIRIAIGLGALTVFVMVTRWEPSVLRACIMAGLTLAAFLFGRKADPRHVLGVAFAGLVAFEPLILWSVGFQLSFAATAGIVLLTPPMLQRLGAPRPGDKTDEGPENSTPGRRLVLQAVAVGAAAQIAVMPLLAWHFGRVSLVAAPANLAAFPLVAPATVLGLTGGLSSLVSEAAAAPLMEASGLFVWGLEHIAVLFGGSAHAQADLPDFKTAQMVAAYLALAAVVAWLTGHSRAARWPVVLAAAVVVASAVMPVAHAGRPAGMRITFFDVGQGDAALVESRGGARILIDGGPDPDQVANRLLKRGVGRLDLVVASHAHFDHVAGLAKVVSRLKVRELVHPGVDDPLMRHIFGDARPRSAREGEKLVIGDLKVEYLAPGPSALRKARDGLELPEEKKEGGLLNDASIVARVSYGKVCALFPGDLEEPGQQELIDSSPGLIDCTVLKAPHHGSAKLLAGFVRKADPEFVAVSTGPNQFGHPTAKALSMFSNAGARVLRTDLLGDIVLDAGPGVDVRVN